MVSVKDWFDKFRSGRTPPTYSDIIDQDGKVDETFSAYLDMNRDKVTGMLVSKNIMIEMKYYNSQLAKSGGFDTPEPDMRRVELMCNLILDTLEMPPLSSAEVKTFNTVMTILAVAERRAAESASKQLAKMYGVVKRKDDEQGEDLR